MNRIGIATDAVYRAALARIDALWDTAPDTPEAAEADRFTLAVRRYERKRFPIPPPTLEQAEQFRRDQQAGRGT